jgi:hypothetical protein
MLSVVEASLPLRCISINYYYGRDASTTLSMTAFFIHKKISILR